VAARIMWACEVTKTRDDSGTEIDVPLYDYTPNFNTQPKWFPFDLQLRNQSGDKKGKFGAG
jgi:hypothetical protein